jgi:AraC-like DNA-binding protein
MRPAAGRALFGLLERDFRSGMGVGDFAAALGVTPTHLTRCCRQTCGRPASSLLQDRKIFEARRLAGRNRHAREPDRRQPWLHLAAYFTRAFHHQTGKSPSAFRRRPDASETRSACRKRLRKVDEPSADVDAGAHSVRNGAGKHGRAAARHRESALAFAKDMS